MFTLKTANKFIGRNTEGYLTYCRRCPPSPPKYETINDVTYMSVILRGERMNSSIYTILRNSSCTGVSISDWEVDILMCVSVKATSILACCEIWIYVSTGQKYCGQRKINKHSNICTHLSEGRHFYRPILMMGGQIRPK